MLLREILGHRRLTTLLARAIERNSLPPTLLLAGPHGKWAVARAMRRQSTVSNPISNRRKRWTRGACVALPILNCFTACLGEARRQR
jgi:hypothetical protein